MKSVRLPVLVTVAALGAALALAAFARMGRAAEDLWQTDFKAAQAKAKGEKKYLLVDFTGSDWCGWCIKLHNEVFDKESFKTVAPKQFVLVELDFPQQKKQADELEEAEQGTLREVQYRRLSHGARDGPRRAGHRADRLS